MPPQTVVGTSPEYRSCASGACERDDRDQREDSDERGRHRDPRRPTIHRAFVRMPTIPVTIR